jgi:3-phenylpropionate/cinnamic acid dioxygenase small subunit
MSDDAEAIRNLLYRYAECIDAADFDGVAALFADGAVSAPGMQEPARGVAAVERLYRSSSRVYEDGTLRTQHLVLNPIVEVDAVIGAATARSRYLVLQATAKLPLQPIIAGRYRDRFERAGGVWRFTLREIQIDLVGDLSEHLRFDLAATLDRADGGG